MTEKMDVGPSTPPLTPAPDPPDVHRGKDGWLFLIGGANQVLDIYTRPGGFPDATVAKWVDLLRARRDRCAKSGVTYLHMIAPEKLSVYFDKFDGELPYREQSPAIRIPEEARAAGLGDVIVDPLPFFMERKEQHKLFWKTDTHWTFEGCSSAMRVLCSRLAVEPSPTIAEGRRITGNVTLDLGGKLTPPVKEEFSTVLFLKSARRVAVNSMVAFKERTKRENDGGLHVGSNVVFCNHRADAVNKSLVLFGDSFAEYRSHLLTGMLAETFREVHFVWSAGIDWSYVDRVKPDILLTELAERFSPQVPRDDMDLDRYVVRRLAPLMTDAPG
jgi:hypothetical protein